MGKDRITGIQKGIYPQLQPELPDLKASVLKLKGNRPELEKLSATENYSQDLIQIRNTADSFSNYNGDSLLSSFLEEAEERATGVLLAEIGEFPSENAGIPDVTSLTESQNSIEDYHANRILEKSKQANHFENRALVDQQRQKLDALKHKYSHVPDSRGLDSLVKKTSIAHLSLFERLEYGGMLRNPSAKPFQLELNPFVGYRINKLFVAGAGAWVQLMPGSDSHAKYTGISFYAMHKVRKSMYATVGYDISETKRNPAENKSIKGSKIWAGVGTDTTLFRTISLRSQVTYGFTQLTKANKDEFQSPWAVFFGIVHFK
ncbi:MAG: hypothetical protein JJU34_18455 [Lunatimonas sp.]|uniref:hypothetical protein n=1 Tax=Lunatimonas sp. TaxID=2060141 RepID=UPI00263B3EFE|nr:hypothetical protein [Lunatimonas sp.]MCC5939268.1 hypothetical protein [Lunatimonas sp.]